MPSPKSATSCHYVQKTSPRSHYSIFKFILAECHVWNSQFSSVTESSPVRMWGQQFLDLPAFTWTRPGCWRSLERASWSLKRILFSYKARVELGFCKRKTLKAGEAEGGGGREKMERERDATDGSHTCEVGGVKEKDLIMFKGSFLDCCFKTHQCAA